MLFPLLEKPLMLPNLIEKTNQTYVLLVLAKYVYATTNFDLGHMIFFHWLWIFRDKIGCLNTLITISLFEAFETSRQTVGRNLQDFLKQCGLTKFFFVMLKMKMQIWYHDSYFEVNSNLWNFGWDGKLSRDLFWTCFLQGLSICNCWRKNL
jgi:hypothetical protein